MATMYKRYKYKTPKSNSLYTSQYTLHDYLFLPNYNTIPNYPFLFSLIANMSNAIKKGKRYYSIHRARDIIFGSLGPLFSHLDKIGLIHQHNTSSSL